MTYQGINGKRYDIADPAIGRGGEGTLYRIEGEPDKVVKILNENCRSDNKHKKIKAMIDYPISEEAKTYIMWPLDIIYDGSSFIGYVEPLFANCEQLDTISDNWMAYNIDYRRKVIIAKNICAAINAVHNAGHVCGDMNPKNIGVNIDSGKVSIFDADSFHIVDRSNARVYRCEVGISEYMSQEVQLCTCGGLSLSTAPLPTYTKYSDLFALAIHIFKLLMNGWHPYSAAIDLIGQKGISVKVPLPNENIRDGFCPFIQIIQKKPGYTIPVYVPSFDTLPDFIQNLFFRAFMSTDPADRPDTIEWYNALTIMQNNLKSCVANPEHFYPNHLEKCPWCMILPRVIIP